MTSVLDRLSLNTQSPPPIPTVELAPASGVPLRRRPLLPTVESPPCSVYSPLHYRRVSIFQPSSTASQQPFDGIRIRPEWVLEAPKICNDFYWNILSWSCEDVLAVALGTDVHIWESKSDTTTRLRGRSNLKVASVEFSQNGGVLGIGLQSGGVELWDIETQSLIRTLRNSPSGPTYTTTSLSWNQHILSSGRHDGCLWHYDVRLARPKVMQSEGHQGSVCGLRWRGDGDMLASSCNGGSVSIWDLRVGDVRPGARGTARWKKEEHTAAVKALSWCPWDTPILATGGGREDGKIHFWNTNDGEKLHTLDLGDSSQVTSIQWSPHQREFMVTLGFVSGSMMAYRYPSMTKLVDIRNAHQDRILWSAVRSDGDVVCTGGADGNLKFWRIWEKSKC